MKKECYDQDSKAGLYTNPLEMNGEHEQAISRLTRKPVPIKFGPMPAASNPSHGGNIPANPFESLAQAHFAYAHPDKFGGKKGLHEWSSETDYSHLPKKK